MELAHKMNDELIPVLHLTALQFTPLVSLQLQFCPFLTLFVWQHIIYFTLEINYFSENLIKLESFVYL